MVIFGKRLSDYVAFAMPVLAFVATVGLLRLGLSLAGVDDTIVKWISITVATWLAVIYLSIRVHTSGFGGYKQLLVLIALLSTVAEAIIVVGIVIAIFSGHDNIFSAPEYSPGADGKTWLHAGAHLVLGIIVGSLISWLVGSVILFVTKRIGGDRGPAAAGA